MRSAVRDWYTMRTDVRIKIPGENRENEFRLWEVPVASEVRELFRGNMQQVVHLNKAVRRISKYDGEGFLKATAIERKQMQAIAHSYQKAPLSVFSIEFSSMTPEASKRFEKFAYSELVNTDGVIGWGMNLVCVERGDLWILD